MNVYKIINEFNTNTTLNWSVSTHPNIVFNVDFDDLSTGRAQDIIVSSKWSLDVYFKESDNSLVYDKTYLSKAMGQEAAVDGWTLVDNPAQISFKLDSDYVDIPTIKTTKELIEFLAMLVVNACNTLDLYPCIKDK